MRKPLLRRVLSMLLVVALLAGYYVPGTQAASIDLTWKETDQEVRLDLTDRQADIHVEEPYAPGDMVRVSIVLEEKSTIQAGFSTRNIANNAEAMAYRGRLQAKQEALAKTISTQALNGKPLDVVWNLTLAGNLISANVPYGKLDSIAQVEGVADVFVENVYQPCVVEREAAANPQMYASIGMVGSSLVWSSGYTGAGSRIAVLDTGTDTNHQSLDSGAFLYALEQNALAAGVEFETYLAGLDLLDAQEIASVLPNLNIYKQDSSVTAAQLYLNEKLPFAVNYVDSSNYRLVVDHESDNQGEHGSHVAGIAAANRYIPQDGGYADALETVMMAGMAPDAQLITMKVFGASGGPTDADYMAAVEDAILLGCDSVNLSLGTSMAGDGFSLYYDDLLEYMTKTDTVVVGSAGNSYSWPAATDLGYLYSVDVSLDTVGAPGSYSSFLAVASVENDGGVGSAFKAAGRTVGYEDGGYGSNNPMSSLDTSADLSGTAYDYIFIDGLGYEEDYAGMDLSGKVVFCSRGTTSFYEKANTAAYLGAAAVVVYNNRSGTFGMDLTDYNYTAPCVSITQVDANAIRAASTQQTTGGGLTYYTGTMTILGQSVSGIYTMSDFSSWGVPGDLSIKPEITAPGGNVYSLYGETPSGGGADQYELMSGTSMSAPAVTGMAALMAQYLRESGLAEQEGMHVRTLAQSLLMSTAVPMMEEGSGSYYSILKQGAGLARVDLAASADSYILVDGQSDGKVKAELGDDPERAGVYEFSFSINNLTGGEKSYALSADLFCQNVFDYGELTSGTANALTLLDTWTTSLPGTATFTANGTTITSQEDLSKYDLNGDGMTNAADADYLLEYLLGNETTLHGEGDVSADGTVSTYDAHVLLALLNSSALVTVPADGSVTVNVCLALTESGKALLDASFANGTYVEAYVYAESVSDEEGVAGTVHSIPVLAFYGSWTEANMFDHGTYVELQHSKNGLMPYMYQLIGNGNAVTIDYGDGNGEYYFGGNPVLQDNDYLPQRNAFNSEDSSKLQGQYFTLIRGATGSRVLITNADTGEVYYQKELGQLYPAYYFVNGGSWENIQQSVHLGWAGMDANGDPLPEGTNVEVTLVSAPEYYRSEDGTHNYGALGEGAYLTTQLTIDNTAPKMISTELVDSTLTVTAQDNQYVAAVVLLNAAGTSTIASASPNQTVSNMEISVELDLSTVYSSQFLLAVYDYARNVTTYEITLELDNKRPRFTAIDRTNVNDDYSVNYVGMDEAGTYATLAPASGREAARAAAYVDGYVFEISGDNKLYVGSDSDLFSFRYLRDLDPEDTWQMVGFNDLAFNKADETLYGLFYSSLNGMATPYLCTIDLYTGQMEVLGEMPIDAHTLAIDGAGNFYSSIYGASQLCRYASDIIATGAYTLVGDLGSYSATNLSAMTWDYETNELFLALSQDDYAYLLNVDYVSGGAAYVAYFPFTCVGLYVAQEPDGSVLGPVDAVTSVELPGSAETLVGNTVQLQAQVWPWNVRDASLTWTSSNTAVATVDANGLVTGVSEGSAVITAASTLDATKKASCTVTVSALKKELKALVWDESGQVWWSSFNTASLPSYTKLAASTDNLPFATTAVIDGTLYAGTLDTSTGLSSLYTVDPATYAVSLVGGSSSLCYTDLAYAPNVGYLLATYFNYIALVDPASGEYLGAWDWSEGVAGDLVGITYYGSEYNSDYAAYMDYFLILDSLGNVYLDAFIATGGSYGYFNGPEYGFTANIGEAVDYSYFQDLYYDGSYAYWTRFNEADNIVQLLAWDCDNSGKVYNLGTFPEGVWPVGGMYSDTELTSAGTLAAEFHWTDVCTNALVASLEAAASSATASGGLNTVSGAQIPVPQSAGAYAEETNQVTVTLTPAEEATNGRMTVTYDAAQLTLTGIIGNTEAFAYTLEDGRITVAFASANALAQSDAVATLTFEVLVEGEHTITVSHTESNNGAAATVETLVVTSGCAHRTYHAVVTAPTCTEQGYTTYTCAECGESYVDDYVDALGHSYNAVATAPTCEAQGYTTYTCATCGDSYTGDYTDPVDHNYVDGFCIWCGEAEYYVDWVSVNTTLTGSIDLNYYVVLSDNLVNVDTYVRFTCNDETVDVPMTDAVVSVKDGVTRYRFSYKVFAKEMTDIVTAQIMTPEGAVGEAMSYSVAKYCYGMIGYSKNAEMVALCKAMLNYGTAAQNYFGYKLHDLANASLSEEDKVVSDFDASAYAHSMVGSEEGIKSTGAKLLLGADVAIQVSFVLTGDKAIEDYTFTIDGVETDYTRIIGEKYYFELGGISASRFDELHAFSVGGLTLNYSVLSYANQAYKATSASEVLIGLVNAMYAYHTAADAYVN